MDVLAAVQEVAHTRPGHVAHRWRDQELSYGELWQRSGALAAALDELDSPGTPVVVLGHKDPRMLVCFLACVRSGHPYVPVDLSTPPGRVADVLATAQPVVVLAVEGSAPDAVPEDTTVWSRPQLDDLVRQDRTPRDGWVGQEDPFYIIFTSGSTGSPKGVEVPRSALDNFVRWGLGLRHGDGVDCGPDGQAVYLNQAPFSFDLSVFDLWLALASGATLFSVDKDAVANPADLLRELAGSGITTWVSTPSFADLCLANPTFGRELLPQLELFLFCGETLPNATARSLLQRFPGAAVVNTYGPTESTVAVTAVNCTPEVLDAHPVLPVGAPRAGTRLLIRGGDGQPLDEGATGEIVIVGDTVALGYHRSPELTARAFELVDGQRAYRTGDAGKVVDGQLFFEGRLDFQVKLHGYRIELEDIEAHLRGIAGVQQAVVVPVSDAPGGAVSHLVAVLQRCDGVPTSPLRQSVADKGELKKALPQYMVPKVFRYLPSLPLTPNGKVDRRAVETLVR